MHIIKFFIFFLVLSLAVEQKILAANYNPTKKIVIIIDDLGNNNQAGLRAIHLPGQLVYAILPHTFFSIPLALTAHKLNKEIILHTPMEPIKPHDLGPGGLQVNMDEIKFLSVLDNDLHAVPYIQGLNNHMGSRLTALSQPMTWLMHYIKTTNLYFIDSVTSAHSIAEKTAKSYGIPSLHRDVFLDDVPTFAAINEQFNQLLDIADSRGYAVAIGHPYPETLNFLEQVLPDLKEEGYELVSASELIHYLANNAEENPTKSLNNNLCEIYPHACEWFKNSLLIST